MFYVEKQGSQPREYELTDTVPAPVGPYRRYITKFEQTPPFIVHSKMHGTHEKAQPYIVRGASKRGELLVQATVATQYEPIGRWLEVECGDTQEGYRFKRYVLKPIATLIKLATNAAKANAQTRKKQVEQASRDEKCGSCPVCFGDYVASGKNPSMVHHGYERPGDGMIHGDCYGVNYPPFEVSCEGTKAWLVALQQQLVRTQELLDGLDTIPSLLKVTGYKTITMGRNRMTLPEHKTVLRGEPEFARELEKLCEKYEGKIESLKRNIATYTKHIADWKPQTFPRAVKHVSTEKSS